MQASGFDKPKILLYWNKYYTAGDFNFGLGQKPFIKAGCPVTNCIATNDRQMLNQSDGILFHAGDFNASDIPAHRLPHQRYIFLLYETLPLGRNNHYFHPRHFFNWTMTHRRDSDVFDPKPYGIIKPKNDIDQLPPLIPRDQKLESPLTLLRKHRYPQLVNRTKLVAWFCSNTHTHGKRELYFKELAKHVQLDIYGKCGNLECLPRNSHTCNHLLDNYKFYLAAENSLCPDYVTEKFYRALENGVVPIVYGGADYTQFAPPHSYINIKDFDTPKDLADFLHLLDKNDALYMEYFQWRGHYTIVRNPQVGWCQLCEMLNDPTLPPKSYESMADYWFDQTPCLDGKLYVEWKLSKPTTWVQ